MNQSFRIDGELTDLNTYIDVERGNKYAAANLKKSETYRCQLAARKLEKIQKPVGLTLYWFTKDLRKDPDNVSFAQKFILDGMVNAGVLPKDSRKWVLSLHHEFGRNNKPYVVVSVTDDVEHLNKEG